MLGRSWFPAQLRGSSVVLRRHAPDNLAAFRSWYSDPEVARLTRYQDGPMRPDEIERFFEARVIGADSLAMAVHVRATDELIGTCAFSQLDGDNGSALYHITIGHKAAWGRGYGTEATALMLGHAFGTLRLHRVSLAVFEFNERAIRSYRRCGFVVEGRARDAIWRDGRFWDEIQMSILEPEWQAMRRGQSRADDDRAGLERAAAPADVAGASLDGGATVGAGVSVGAGASVGAGEAPVGGAAGGAAAGAAASGASPISVAPVPIDGDRERRRVGAAEPISR